MHIEKYVFEKRLQPLFGFLGMERLRRSLQGAINFRAFFVGRRRRAGTHPFKARKYAINKKERPLPFHACLCSEKPTCCSRMAVKDILIHSHELERRATGLNRVTLHFLICLHVVEVDLRSGSSCVGKGFECSL